MSLSPEQQKANAKALCWLADKLRDFDPARFAEDKNLAPIPEEWKQFLYRGVRVRPEPTILMLNPFLINAIKYLTQKFGLRMVEATEALGVEDCSFEPLSVLPWILVERLPTVYPDGKRTVFQLAADAIIPEPLTDQEFTFMKIGKFLETLAKEKHKKREDVLEAIMANFEIKKRTAEKAIAWLCGKHLYTKQWRGKCDNSAAKRANQKAYGRHA